MTCRRAAFAIAATLVLSAGSALAAPADAGLACDARLKTAFRPDPLTSVVLVKAFKAGDPLVLAEPVTPRTPKAAKDVCLVKLNVGPGSPGPAGAPSTSAGIGIEIWLPTHENWNKRVLAIGGGGYQGGPAGSAKQVAAPHAAIAAINYGAVSSTTDTGHASKVVLGTAQPRGDFALNPDASLNTTLMADFSVRAIHEQAVKTKALAAAYYGRPAERAYWQGGSTGGRQGHKLAQAYPEDFDGIIANYPALYWSKFVLAAVYPQLVIQRDLGGQALSEAQLDLASNAGRKAASTTFNYSPALKASGLKWDKATLDEFLSGPMKKVPGGRMLISLKDQKQRADLIAFLATQK